LRISNFELIELNAYSANSKGCT